MSFL
ncbi:hypothetical protein LINPERPRIM_LOCUS29629, partial [Linum perenne]|jgi:hypothetical protein